jgi:hypothetical protein
VAQSALEIGLISRRTDRRVDLVLASGETGLWLALRGRVLERNDAFEGVVVGAANEDEGAVGVGVVKQGAEGDEAS